MTDFQKEVGIVALLLAFFFAFSVYAEIARTGKGIRRGTPAAKVRAKNEDTARASVADLFRL